MPFRTHTGEVVEGERLQQALSKVAADWRELAHAIRQGDDYADHVTEAEKDAALHSMLTRADEIDAGDVRSFTIWQRVDAELTGECVGLLSRG